MPAEEALFEGIGATVKRDTSVYDRTQIRLLDVRVHLFGKVPVELLLEQKAFDLLLLGEHLLLEPPSSLADVRFIVICVLRVKHQSINLDFVIQSPQTAIEIGVLGFCTSYVDGVSDVFW